MPTPCHRFWFSILRYLSPQNSSFEVYSDVIACDLSFGPPPQLNILATPMLPPVQLSTTYRLRLHTGPCNCWISNREIVNTNFYDFWFDPTGNQTRVYVSVADAVSARLQFGKCDILRFCRISNVKTNITANVAFKSLFRVRGMKGRVSSKKVCALKIRKNRKEHKL